MSNNSKNDAHPSNNGGWTGAFEMVLAFLALLIVFIVAFGLVLVLSS